MMQEIQFRNCNHFWLIQFWIPKNDVTLSHWYEIQYYHKAVQLIELQH